MPAGLPGGLGDIVANAQQAFRTGGVGGLAGQAGALLRSNAGGLIVGGLAGLALGSRTGRGIVGGAAQLGGLALVGGLAYKAFQNYQAGRPLTHFGEDVSPAPASSGFGEGTHTDQERALLMVRAMVAAAASDGAIDATERQRILGNLKEVGLDDEAAAFLDHELATPLSADRLAMFSTSKELATQIYTAARLAIDPDTEAERRFLSDLARRLDLEEALVQHVDAAAASVVSHPA